MGSAEFVGLFRIQTRVDAAIDHPGSALTCQPADFQTTASVGRVDAHAHHVTRLNALDGQRFECLIGNDRGAVLRGSSRCQHIQPAGSDDANSERHIARVDKMYRHDVRTSDSAQQEFNSSQRVTIISERWATTGHYEPISVAVLAHVTLRQEWPHDQVPPWAVL